MVYGVPLIVFMDDVLGNISKQSNKHHIIYMSNPNLPQEMVEKEFCVRFVTSLPHAAPMELMAAMKESISSEQGVDAWDCIANKEILLCPYALLLAGDNPMQAEECSHGGLRCNLFCRTCEVGGTKDEKELLEDFEALFKLRNATSKTGISDSGTKAILNTLAELGKSIHASFSRRSQINKAEIRKQLEDALEDLLRPGKSIKDYINPLLGMPNINIHLDTPTEVLHTFLLGIVKYYWSQTVMIIDKAKAMELFQMRLAALSTEGLNALAMNAEYICQHRGGLIGKHFKSLAQLMPFVVYDLVPSYLLQAWNTISKLVVLLWHSEIKNLEVYLV
ncbi:hypothetical protein C8Q80DRAFT_1216103 [Daedaleopsis nitida]|nr:hypothetical protein C8Q80DRAFT_1216103 [Daedaleopsis nitida]